MGWKRTLKLWVIILVLIAGIVLILMEIFGRKVPEAPVVVRVERCLEDS